MYMIARSSIFQPFEDLMLTKHDIKTENYHQLGFYLITLCIKELCTERKKYGDNRAGYVNVVNMLIISTACTCTHRLHKFANVTESFHTYVCDV